MNYKESKKILQYIKSANKILINCHEHPDADSVGGALATYFVLKRMGKIVDIVCPEELQDELKFLPNADQVKRIDFQKIDFSKYDLFLSLDTSSWSRVCASYEVPVTNIPIIQIDHHKLNEKYGTINLIDSSKPSNCEILYGIFSDWKQMLSENIAQCLLAGIIGDTGSFQYTTSPETLELAAKLIRLGGNKEEINLNLFRSIEFENLKIIGEILRNITFDREGKFIWSAVPYEFLKNYTHDLNLDVVDVLLQGTKNAKFGIRMIERSPKDLRVSFRARTDFDTSKIAKALGGGGHAVASGAIVKGMEFKKAVENVLQTVRKYTQ